MAHLSGRALGVDSAIKRGWSAAHRFEDYTLAYAGRDHLPLITQREVVQGLIAAFPDLKIADLFRIKAHWFDEPDHLFVAIAGQSERVVGILASRWCRTPAVVPFLHVSILLIAPPYQRGALIKRFWRCQFEKFLDGPDGFPTVIAYRTYNPVAFTAMQAFARIPGIRIYPDIGYTRQNADMMELAVRIAEVINPGLALCPNTGVLKGAGEPRDFYPELPHTRRADVGSYFNEQLTPGDRILCILRIDAVSARAALLRAFGLGTASKKPTLDTGLYLSSAPSAGCPEAQ